MPNHDDDARPKIEGDGWTLEQPAQPYPRLPRVLLIGDSILAGYRQTVYQLLAGRANADAWVTGIHEGAPELPRLLREILAQGPYALVHFNIGLHGWPEGRVPDGQYVPLMQRYVQTLREGAPQARLIWASTTPVTVEGRPQELHPEINPIIAERNALAAEIVRVQGIRIHDLYALMLPHLDLGRGDRFHWQPEGSAIQGQAVAAAILAETIRAALQSAPDL